MRQHRNAQAIDLSGYMIWATANQRTPYYIPFGPGASIASGDTYTMCNTRIGYVAGGLGWVSGRAPPSFFTLWRRSLGTIYGVCLLLSCADRVLNPRRCVQIMVAGAPGRTNATI